jgi:hypothetical protein
MMISIQVDETTAQALEDQAKRAGMTVGEYVRTLLPFEEPPKRPAWEEIEQQIVALSTDGPSLPADFSRADIYRDHD